MRHLFDLSSTIRRHPVPPWWRLPLQSSQNTINNAVQIAVAVHPIALEPVVEIIRADQDGFVVHAVMWQWVRTVLDRLPKKTFPESTVLFELG